MADLYGLEASGLPPELIAQLAGTQGRRKVAESMLQRGLTPQQVQQGTMSWTQGLAQLANAYLGRKGVEEADKEAQSIAEKRKSMVSEALANYEKQRMGQAMQTAPFQADTFPGEVPIEGLQSITQQAVPADRRGAARTALASPFRELQNAASTDLKFDEMEEMRAVREQQAKLDAAIKLAQLNKEKGFKVGETRTVQMGPEAVTQEWNGSQWQEIGRGPKFAPPSKTDVRVNVDKGDNKYAETRLGDAAKAAGELDKAAEGAYKTILAMDRFKEASKNGVQGGVQPAITGVQNLLSTFGYSADSLKDVRSMEQAIGDVLGNRMAELGARGLTDKDMQILRDALPRVATDRASRDAVAEIVQRSAEFTIREWEAARKQEEVAYPGIAQRLPKKPWYEDYKKRGAKPSQPKSAPAGIDPKVWAAMTPEEQALWN